MDEADIVPSEVRAQVVDQTGLAACVTLREQARGLFEHDEMRVFEQDLQMGSYGQDSVAPIEVQSWNAGS